MRDLRRASIARLGLLAAGAIALLGGAAPRARAASDDTSYVRFEFGGSSDMTNERFYEDSFDDTTFTGRRLTGSPEYRTAGIAALDAAAILTRGGRLLLRQEGAAGDHLLRSYTRLEWSGAPREGWKAQLVPDLDIRRDRSFGSDRREVRFRPEGRVRAVSLDHANTYELLAGGDWARFSGTSELLTLDRNAGRAWARWSHAPLDARWETEVGYGIDARMFPDSVSRDHIEQHGSLALRRLLPGGGSGALELQLDRRAPYYSTASTRDHFWSGRADLNAFVPLHEKLTLEFLASVDGYRYDRPDTSVYFDYQTVSARPSMRWALVNDWSVRVGPRFEWLVSPRVVSERYRQVAAAIELERLHGREWWAITPSAGWRQYDRSAATVTLDEPDLHSSYLFVEGEWFSEFSLPAAARLRLTGSARYESHEDPSQDATSLYLAIDVRRGF